MEVIINSYFSGAGIGDAGLVDADITIGKAFELDPDAVKTYRANFGYDAVTQCDLTQELVLTQNECHGMMFTYPCTRYSSSADIHQTRTGDELFLHALRHIALASPDFYIVENVMGMRKFPVVMECMTKLPNYYITTICPVETHTWLPQVRPRLIVFATKRPFTPRPPQCNQPTKLKQILERDPKVTLPISIYKRLAGAYRDKPIISDPEKGDIAPTCVSHYARDRSTRLVVDKRFPHHVRPYSVREYARLQWLRDSFIFPVSDNAAYKQIGNGVPRDMTEWIGHEVTRYMNQCTRRI